MLKALFKTDNTKNTILRNIAYLLTLITGFTGLVYQVTWHKYLSFYLGSHALATSIVLSVFFLFLSLGYITLGRSANRIPLKNKLFLYGIVEFLIGAYVLISPEFFHILADAIPIISGSVSKDLFYGFIFASLFIGFPTYLMGSTIPILTLAMSDTFEKSHNAHATVYGLNTLGAVGGALVTGFVFIEKYGLPLTLLLTSFINIGVGLTTWIISKASPDGFHGAEIADDKEAEKSSSQPAKWTWLLLTISALSGFYVFSLENIVIRVSALSIGSNNYTYSIIVSAFIFGIALGSLLISRINVNKRLTFFWIQAGLCLSLLVTYLLIPEWPTWFGRIDSLFNRITINIDVYWSIVTIVFVLILVTPTALMGMNLPLLFNYLREKNVAVSRTVGKIYAINTLGSVFGSIVGGYLLLAYVDWDTAFLINIALVVITLPMILILSGSRNRNHTFSVGSAVVACFAVMLLFMSPWDINKFLPRPSNFSLSPTNASYSDLGEHVRKNHTVNQSFYGPSSHAGIVAANDHASLHINGNPNTSADDYAVRAMNAVYPLSLVTKPEKVFVVGLGGGLSTSIFAKAPSVESVTVSEISSSVVKTLPFFDKDNEGLTQQDYFSKVDIDAVDAIKLLRVKQDEYDIIVSEPNHPWVTGVENLFSKEFLTEVKNNLSDKGVYCQWFPLFGSNLEIVLTMLNTITDVFDHVYVFSSGLGTVALVAGKNEIKVDLEQIDRAHAILPQKLLEHIPALEEDPKFILSLQIMSDSSVRNLVSEFEPIQTLEFPKISYQSYDAKFIGSSLNLDQEVFSRVKLGTHASEKSKFLYEQVASELNDTFFLDSFDSLFSMRFHQSLNARFWRMNEIYKDSDWPMNSPEKIEEYHYLLGESIDVPDHLIVDADETSQRTEPYESLYRSFTELHFSQVPVAPNKLIRLLPETCGEKITCTRVKSELIVLSSNIDNTNRELLDAADISYVDKLFDELLRP